MRQFPPIELVAPKWQDPLVEHILALEELRYPNPERAATHPVIFDQLREVLQTLESVASARIEGNRTTLADYLDSQRGAADPDDAFREILNIEAAIAWIEEIPDRAIDAAFIKELHARIIEGLVREGDLHPGRYRNHSVRIGGSSHRPPATRVDVEREMRHLLDFGQRPLATRNELLRIALFHHRFMAIHPFGNGNGRAGRLVTYAMLLQGGYRADIGQTINPAAVFCLSRDRYYEELSNADTFEEEGLLSWCAYLIGGIRDEIVKINKVGRVGLRQGASAAPHPGARASHGPAHGRRPPSPPARAQISCGYEIRTSAKSPAPPHRRPRGSSTSYATAASSNAIPQTRTSTWSASLARHSPSRWCGDC